MKHKLVMLVLCSFLLTGCSPSCSRQESVGDAADADGSSGVVASSPVGTGKASDDTGDTADLSDTDLTHESVSGVTAGVSATDNDAVLDLTDVSVFVVRKGDTYAVTISGNIYNLTEGSVTSRNLPDITLCGTKMKPELEFDEVYVGSHSGFVYSCDVSDVDAIDISVNGVSGKSDLGFVDSDVTESVKRGGRDALDVLPTFDITDAASVNRLAARIATAMAYADVVADKSDSHCVMSEFTDTYSEDSDTFNVSCTIANEGSEDEPVIVMVTAYDKYDAFVDSRMFEIKSIAAGDSDTVTFAFGPYNSPADTLIDHFDYSLLRRLV